MAGIVDVLADALREPFDRLEPGADPVVRASNRAGIDFQVNGAVAVARRLGRRPDEVAAEIVASSVLDRFCEGIEVAPQGFVNLVLSRRWLAEQVAAQVADPRLGYTPVTDKQTVVVDYSHPNVAKEMHAGHLRTTVIGDAICRLLDYAGHRVIRENHIGDWGTPFGMLIEHLRDIGEEKAAHELSVGDLNSFYREARAKFEESEEFRERSRKRVVLLQSGDEETLRLWRVLVDQSLAYFDEVYAKLGVLLTRADVVGESFYNPMLPGVVQDLADKGILVESEGALCAFPPGWTNRDGTPLPLIVQKSDGGYGYAATDLASLRDRFGRLGADLTLYVVGAPQAQHLAMCFAVAAEAGWLPSPERAVHVPFGNVLGADRRMFKTRTGDTVKLVDVLDEAVDRAAAVVAEKSPHLDQQARAEVARMVGIGAVKYADLSTDRVKDYVFDWDRMLSFDGNTAPYLQYARVRCLSILRRAGADPSQYASGRVPVSLEDPAEKRLAVALLGFPVAVEAVMENWSPHRLCSYLYELAGTYTQFFENCPVLRAPDDATRDSRLVLCVATAAVLAKGLSLLGIEAPERM